DAYLWFEETHAVPPCQRQSARACLKPIPSGCEIQPASERESMTDAAFSCRFRWIVRARSRTPSEAFAFLRTDLPTVNFNFTCHKRVCVAPMRQARPVSKFVGQYHAGTLCIC